ncbi:MAG: 50S ribosomal protein L5 [Candidatus Woesebacteria bacterium]|nr:50S ribosomal protein L5 [Candidatus Woesebacteria bacterium]
MSRLNEKYNKEIKKTLVSEFGVKNVMAIPRLTKININVGIGDSLKNKELKESLIRDFTAIAGQKLAEKQAKLSVATFGIREGMVVGLAATLRGERMYDFFDKFVNIVLPRLRDFRGVKRTSFDRFGSYTVGLTDHTVFPEIDITKAANPHGMEITFVTNAGSIEKGTRLLELMGMPFIKN